MIPKNTLLHPSQECSLAVEDLSPTYFHCVGLTSSVSLERDGLGKARTAVFPFQFPISSLLIPPNPRKTPACPAGNGLGCDHPILPLEDRCDSHSKDSRWCYHPIVTARRPRQLQDHSWVLFDARGIFAVFEFE